MTTRNPLDGEREIARPKYDPEKRYRYTWPGQSPRVTTGAELNTLCAGADPARLAIEEVTSPGGGLARVAAATRDE